MVAARVIRILASVKDSLRIPLIRHLPRMPFHPNRPLWADNFFARWRPKATR